MTLNKIIKHSKQVALPVKVNEEEEGQMIQVYRKQRKNESQIPHEDVSMSVNARFTQHRGGTKEESGPSVGVSGGTASRGEQACLAATGGLHGQRGDRHINTASRRPDRLVNNGFRQSPLPLP